MSQVQLGLAIIILQKLLLYLTYTFLSRTDKNEESTSFCFFCYYFVKELHFEWKFQLVSGLMLQLRGCSHLSVMQIVDCNSANFSSDKCAGLCVLHWLSFHFLSANILLQRGGVWKPNSKSHISAEGFLLSTPRFEWCLSQTLRQKRGVWVKHHAFFQAPRILVEFFLSSEILKHQFRLRVVLYHKYVYDLFVESSFVQLQTVSWRKSLFIEVTWNRYSFQVVGLNMISYPIPMALLATHFANWLSCLYGSSICLFSCWNHLFTFFHHRLHLLIQSLEVGSRLILNYQFFRKLV